MSIGLEDLEAATDLSQEQTKINPFKRLGRTTNWTAVPMIVIQNWKRYKLDNEIDNTCNKGLTAGTVAKYHKEQKNHCPCCPIQALFWIVYYGPLLRRIG